MTKEERKDKARCKRWLDWWKRQGGNERTLFALQEAIEAGAHEKEEAQADHDETNAAMAEAMVEQLADLRDLFGGFDRAMRVCKASRLACW